MRHLLKGSVSTALEGIGLGCRAVSTKRGEVSGTIAVLGVISICGLQVTM